MGDVSERNKKIKFDLDWAVPTKETLINDIEIPIKNEVDKELWEEWKLTVPRNKSLEDRLIELIKEDKEE